LFECPKGIATNIFTIPTPWRNRPRFGLRFLELRFFDQSIVNQYRYRVSRNFVVECYAAFISFFLKLLKLCNINNYLNVGYCLQIVEYVGRICQLRAIGKHLFGLCVLRKHFWGGISFL
jgi:hypothetical protein